MYYKTSEEKDKVEVLVTTTGEIKKMPTLEDLIRLANYHGVDYSNVKIEGREVHITLHMLKNAK